MSSELLRDLWALLERIEEEGGRRACGNPDYAGGVGLFVAA